MKCIFIKENSQECQANSMTNCDYCYLHNPKVPKEEKQLVQSQGGKANIVKVEKELPPIIINSLPDVVLLLKDTIYRVRDGQLDLRIANTIGFLSSHLLKALEILEVQKKVESVERIILERKTK